MREIPALAAPRQRNVPRPIGLCTRMTGRYGSGRSARRKLMREEISIAAYDCGRLAVEPACSCDRFHQLGKGLRQQQRE
jgi:hypothetical protein